MSGHSKWSKVKHQKATTDVVKAAAFTKASRAITLAIRAGGGITDPAGNFRLRLAIEKARAVNMPKDNIERAIERAAGSGSGGVEEVMYEAYGPGGVAMMIEAVTDNRQRTVSAVKNILDRAGGTLANPGAVNYLFEKVGVFVLAKDHQTLDGLMEIALESGADDVQEKDDVFEMYTRVSVFSHVKDELTKRGVHIEEMAIVMRPISPLPLDPSGERSIEGLMDQLESLDDVQNVYTTVA